MSDLKDEVVTIAAQAVAALQSRTGGRLDYSEASLSVIEDALAECCQYPISEDLRSKIVQQFGCYVLEVARRQFGGEYRWYEKGQQPILIVGEPAFHVAMMTWDKVRGRLSGDTADNIPFFYAGFAEQALSAAPGTRVLYV